ncbi:unnamed protein product [Toxocara canis]|uniref:TPR_REGION domain-containing protein n=1 Tax=Toxocara canis TaxID=6265 RepID=A0A183TY94_TOXCA|nr:unnamed protein product [Toxocara canis]
MDEWLLFILRILFYQRFCFLTSSHSVVSRCAFTSILNGVSSLFFEYFPHFMFCFFFAFAANYYSLRGDHEKSVVFLQRSLKLNPNNSSVWTLIGHEFMEQKNNSAACLAYRKAVQSDPNDYRGWYGLGQLYDILKMPSYSLYYYQQAHKCKSDDSRMLVALGEVYTRLNRVSDAQKCLLKAFKVGDVEGTALMLLGKLFEKGKEDGQAAAVYEKYLETYCDDLVSGFLFLDCWIEGRETREHLQVSKPFHSSNVPLSSFCFPLC